MAKHPTNYRSGLERKVAASLNPRFSFETIKLPYTVTHTYLADFVDEKAKEIVECKGRFVSSGSHKDEAITITADEREWLFDNITFERLEAMFVSRLKVPAEIKMPVVDDEGNDITEPAKVTATAVIPKIGGHTVQG